MRKLMWGILLLAACSQHEQTPLKSDLDYLVFGHFYGECVGEQCIEIYMLTQDHLYEDTNDNYPSNSSAYVGNFQQVSDTLFAKVKATPLSAPAQLLATPSGTIGAPDAADGGGIYFELTRQGVKQFWLIDKVKTNLPDYLVPFIADIESKIALINK